MSRGLEPSIEPAAPARAEAALLALLGLWPVAVAVPVAILTATTAVRLVQAGLASFDRGLTLALVAALAGLFHLPALLPADRRETWALLLVGGASTTLALGFAFGARAGTAAL